MQRADDRLITEKARSDNRILLTFDPDFGAILALGVVDRPSIVIFRLGTLWLVQCGPYRAGALSRAGRCGISCLG
jgi:predicted nuclease of predicted toxin-antitoxin system